jgi:hypothetical protein
MGETPSIRVLLSANGGRCGGVLFDLGQASRWDDAEIVV